MEVDGRLLRRPEPWDLDPRLARIDRDLEDGPAWSVADDDGAAE